MPFIHPAIFWTGLAAASIPIIIHLLNRRRFKIREWAAMKFLLESIRKNRRRVRVEELILLAIRTLVLVLLALAVGRFTGCNQGNETAPSGNSAIVYVLDDSISMGQKLGSNTLFSAAVTDLTEQIRKLPQNDTVAVVLTSQLAPGKELFPPEFMEKDNVERLVQKLQSARLSDGRANLADALAAADSLMNKDSGQSKQVVLISDYRHVDLGKEQTDSLKQRFADLKAKKIKVTTVDYGRPAKSNLTIESIKMSSKFAVARQPIYVSVGVRNNGQTRVENVDLSLSIKFPKASDGREMDEVSAPKQTIRSLEPNAVQHVDCAVTAPSPGPAVVTASLSADELGGDNSASLAIEARNLINILVIDGYHSLSNPGAQESEFFVTAMDPWGDHAYGNKVDVHGPDDLPNLTLDDYDMVVLMNVPDFPSIPLAEVTGAENDQQRFEKSYPKLVALENYVRNGGGLAIFTGDRIDLAFYGQTDPLQRRGRFFNNGQGLLPLPLTERAGDPNQFKNYYLYDIKSVDETDNLMQTFRSFKQSGVDVCRLNRFYAFSSAVENTRPGPTSQGADRPVVRRLINYNDDKGSPAVVAKEYGKGTVVLFTSTGSASWTDWPQDEAIGTYVAVMNDLRDYLAQPTRLELTALVGQGIVYTPPGKFRDARATLRTPRYPDVEEVTLSVKDQDGQKLLEFQNPTNAGMYRLTMELANKDKKDLLLARNGDPIEGQLAPGRQPEITAALGGSEKDYTYVDRSGSNPGSVNTLSDKEYWLYAIIGMLVLMAAETFLGQRFGHYAETKKS